MAFELGELTEGSRTSDLTALPRRPKDIIRTGLTARALRHPEGRS
jgi:hypothetical protein